MSALSPRQMFLLDQACKPINEGFGSFGCYLVGTAADRQAYRDVDVRFIMADKHFDRLHKAVKDVGISFLGLSIGQYLASLTGLPIDFQIQRQTEANHHHGGKMRNALGHRSLANYVGDAPRIAAGSDDTRKAGGTDESQDADVSDEVIATLWPDPETRPQRAKKCRRCGLIYTKGSHFLDCPERGWDYIRKAGDE